MRAHKRFAVVAGAAMLALGGGVAWATIPDSGGQIHGCYTKFGGILRVIDTGRGQSCNSAFEVPIGWNDKGQPGAVGPAGPTGADGSRGPQGEPGPQGVAGPEGIQGPRGERGLTFTGPWSARNYNNSDVVTYLGSSWYAIEFPGPGDVPGSSPDHWALVAEKGADGQQGPKGDKGDPGQVGATGAVGPSGPAGGVAGWEIVKTAPHVVNGLDSGHEIALCPLGKYPVGGGVETFVYMQLSNSYPYSNVGWYGGVYNQSFFQEPFWVYVICVSS